MACGCLGRARLNDFAGLMQPAGRLFPTPALGDQKHRVQFIPTEKGCLAEDKDEFLLVGMKVGIAAVEAVWRFLRGETTRWHNPGLHPPGGDLRISKQKLMCTCVWQHYSK